MSQQTAEELHQAAIAAAQSGELKRSLDLIDRSIAADPADVATHSDRALILKMLGRTQEALESCDRALKLAPDAWEPLMRRGNLLLELGLLDAALANHTQAVRVAPLNARVHYNFGTTLIRAERWDEALQSFERVLNIDPGNLDTLVNRGFVLEKLGRFEAALASYDAVIRLDTRSVAAHSNRGNVLRELKRLPEALVSLERALALDPRHVGAQLNRGVVLSDLDRVEEALASFQRAIEFQSDSAKAHYLRGTLFARRGDFETAILGYEQALRLEPGYADAHEALSFALLITGQLERGWMEHEWRRTRRNLRGRGAARPWLGEESVAGKIVLLRGEAGLGDNLHFCRYVPLVARLGARVVLEAPQPLLRLLGRLPGVERLIEDGNSTVEADFYCSLMSLPLVFKTRLDTIPASRRYIESDPQVVARWQARLGPPRNLRRIGIVFSGNPAHANDAHRSIPLADWMRHMPQDLEFHCLQRDLKPTDLVDLTADTRIVNHAADLTDMSETAALCECMDLIVSVDTSVAHLAAALGKPVWILLPKVGLDWRWLLAREDSPWYPSARLYRQELPGSWESTLRRVAADLRAGAPNPTPDRVVSG